MDTSPLDGECAAVRDDLAALAVGTLTGRQRAELLVHLEGCARCAAELEELSAAADALITLIPDAVPPEGFAARTTALMRAEPKVRQRPMLRRVLAVAAVVAALAIGVGVGEVVASSGGAGQPVGVRTAVLHRGSQVTGTVVLSPGSYGWLVMNVADAGTSGAVACRVTLADGTRLVVGHFPLDKGYGSWAVRLPVASSSVRAVSVLDAKGATIASARLTSE